MLSRETNLPVDRSPSPSEPRGDTSSSTCFHALCAPCEAHYDLIQLVNTYNYTICSIRHRLPLPKQEIEIWDAAP